VTKPVKKVYKSATKVTKPAAKVYNQATGAPAKPKVALSPMAEQKAQQYRAGADGKPDPKTAEIKVPVGDAAGILAAKTAIATQVNPLWKARYGFWPSSSN
jgi:hypothetical protein